MPRVAVEYRIILSSGNLTADKDSYEYEYDYENRIVKITRDSSDIAEFAYDALGRRIRKIDSAAGEMTLYYYNYNWQVLAEYDGSNNLQRMFIYGNYIDEVLLMKAGENDYYYAHDHLYSPAALIDSSGTVLERCEYDAYGNCSILEPNFAPDPDGKSDYGNPYAFQGKNLDLLDNGGLELMYWPYRYYSTYLGRWLQAEKVGMIPNDNQKINPFDVLKQYTDGLNLYEAFDSNPLVNLDTRGLLMGRRPFPPPPIWIIYPIRGRIPSPYGHLTRSLKRVCDAYDSCKCCKAGVMKYKKEECYREAHGLASRYYVKFTKWAEDNPGYRHCTTIAAAIMSFKLDAGLDWFKLRSMQNFAPDSGWWPPLIRRGHFVGVFHRCNKDLHESPARCDKAFDPHEPFLEPWSLLLPKIEPGRLGWDSPAVPAVVTESF